MEEKQVKTKSGTWGCWTLCALVFGFIVAAIIGVNSSRSGSSTKDALDGKGVFAFTACKHAVAERLKSPGSADFQSVFQVAPAYAGNGQYFIRSYVDSQNGFGAVLRTPFDCVAETKDGETFKVTALNLKGR